MSLNQDCTVLSCKQKRILSQFDIFLKLSMSTRHLYCEAAFEGLDEVFYKVVQKDLRTHFDLIIFVTSLT